MNAEINTYCVSGIQIKQNSALLTDAVWCCLMLCGSVRYYVMLCGAVFAVRCYVMLFGAVFAVRCYVMLCGAVLLCGAM